MDIITDKLNAVVAFIEANLLEKTDKEEISRITRMSFSDVNRLFLLLAEVSVSEYVRKRRMSLAGINLKYGESRVIDAAMKYGYDSPVSFARAFQDFHGFNPGLAQRDELVLNYYPRLIFSIQVKGVKEMIRKDVISINGKEYVACYYGEADMSAWSPVYEKREFWKVENGYDDFKNMALTGRVLPYNNFPAMDIQIGESFIIDYHRKGGFVERKYYIADGDEWKGLQSTIEVVPYPTKPIYLDHVTVKDKEYDAEYYGESDISSWSKHKSREFRRLLNTGEDFVHVEKGIDVLPYTDYPPLRFENGDVFELTYHENDGGVLKRYYTVDGTVWEGLRCTRELEL